LGLLLHLADQPFSNTQPTGRSSSSTRLAFDYKGFRLESGTASYSDLKLKELEAALLQQQQAPHVAAAAAAVAVSCLLAASVEVDSKLQQQVVLQLRRQGAEHAAADVDELLTGGEDAHADASDAELDSYTDEAEAEAEAAAAAEQDGADASDAGAAGGLGAAALLRLSPVKVTEVGLLARESFQMVMSRELLGVARKLQQP
jgi:hypothetical protein